MKTFPSAARLALSGAFVWAATALHAATYYVAPTGSDANSGSSAAPFLTIQKGVDMAFPGDTVLVSPGTYATGRTTPSGSCFSRVVIDKNITVRSTHGAAQTVIQGQPHSSTSVFGTNSVRCVYLASGVLDGFTLLNGFANASAPPSDKDNPRINGGGVYAPVNNWTSRVDNCIITGCGAYRGGGAYWATLDNCTVVSNHVNTTSGVGVWGSRVRNSIVMYNTGAAGTENYASERSSVDKTLFTYSCTVPAPGLNYYGVSRDGGNNITNGPLFAAGTLQPGSNSPCINAGTNAYAFGVRDAAGNDRIRGDRVDIGAYESTYILSLTLPEIVGGVLGIPQPVTVSNITVDGISLLPPSVRLGPVADNGVAYFTTVYTNAGTLIFPWRVSSEAGYDKLALLIDGVEVAAISGETNGVVTHFVPGAGAHLIKWMYSKDGSIRDGSDAGWVEPVTWIPNILAAELGVANKPVTFPYGLPGPALPFPYGWAGCFVDTSTNLPAGAIGGAAVRLGGLISGVPLVGDNQTNGVQVILNGAGNLSFRWRTSCQPSDYLICFIDGAEAGRISNVKADAWVTFTTDLLTVGAHTVRWAYAKNASGFDGLDCGWVDSVTWTQFFFPLTVVNGSGDGTYAVGDLVAITADPPPAGQVFDVWDGDTETVTDPHAPATTVVMPGRAITVRALYKLKVLQVTVVNGRDAGAWPNAIHESTGEPEGSYPAGSLVRIVANPAPLWQTFSQWTSAGGAVFSNAYADVTMFVMPTNDVTVTATYRPQTEPEKLAGALTIRGQPLAISAFSSNGVVAQATGGIRYDDPVVKLGGPSVGPNQSVSLTTTNFTGNGYLLFWWHGDAEDQSDGVKVEVNGALQYKLFSMKETNRLDKTTWWSLYGYALSSVTNVTWRFVRDDTYLVHNNMVLIDRVTWIPEGMVNALDAGGCIPNINSEYDPLFQGRHRDDTGYNFEGEDGGVAWVHDAPGGGDAIRLGAFGYVTNNSLAQVAVTNYSTGILTWEWTARCEAVYDELGFYLDGTRTNWISGKGDGTWQDNAFVVKNIPGKSREDNQALMRIFMYRYTKDADVSMFEDCAWLRQVKWAPTFALDVTFGTNTAYVLQAPFNTLADAISEAKAGIFPAGTQITLLADPAPAGFFFDRWVGNDVTALGPLVTDPNPTFLMPPMDLSLTATFTTNAPSAPHYSLTVVNGSGSGSYTNGTTVAIQADALPLWHVFGGWTGDIATVANPASAATTVLIQTNDLAVTATFTPMPLGTIIPLIIGVPPPVTTGNLTVDNIRLTPPAVRLGPVGDTETAFFETVYTNAGTVIFPWSVSCEENYDRLIFSVDGTPVASITGEASGVVTNFVAGAGPHVLRWAYTKDVSDAAGADAGYVGAVTWIPDALAAEFGVSGRPLFFPDGFTSVLLDVAPPSGAVSNIAAKLGGPIPVPNGAETAVEAAFSGSGKLAFHWRTASELNHDFLVLSVDGVEAARISGTKAGWLLFETNLLTVATHTVRWTYKKDAANSVGLDCGWVDSVTWTQFTYPLIVENGSGDGTYAIGSTVIITADPAPAGQEFSSWDGDTESVANLAAPSTSLVMPARAITIRALYRPIILSVTVVNGRDAGALPNPVHESTGEPEGAYPAGAFVRIVAATAPLWQTFDHWVSTNGAVFADAYAPVTYFTMPANPVRVETVYRNMTANEKLADALNIAGQKLNVAAFSTNGVVTSSAGGVRYNDPVVKFGGASVGPNQNVSLTFTNFTGDGILLYWWRATAESRYDKIELVQNGGTVVGSNSGKGTAWQLSTNRVYGATSLAFRFTRDGTYYVRDNTILIDRVTWIPKAMIDTLGCGTCVPDINGEGTGFSGEDGGVAWVTDAPSGSSALRLGRFGYVNNNQHAQLSVTNIGTGIYMWQWASSSEANCDFLSFYSDGTLKRWISGKEQAWYSAASVVSNQPAFTREANREISHVFLFDYSKDSDVSVFDDCAWLRSATWTPTYLLTLNVATNTAFALPLAFAGIPEVQQEAMQRIFPAGTDVTIKANDPAPTFYFDSWEGDVSVLPPGGVTDPAPTFVMPGYDVVLTATYTTNVPSPGPTPPSPASQVLITGLTVVPDASSATSVQQTKSFKALGTATASRLVVLDFEGSSQTDYLLTWSPDLANPASQWQPLDIQYREVLGDSPSGSRMIRLYVEIPAGSPRGFFRVRSR